MSTTTVIAILGFLAGLCLVLFVMLNLIACPFWSLIPGVLCLSFIAIAEAITKAPVFPN